MKETLYFNPITNEWQTTPLVVGVWKDKPKKVVKK